MFYQPDLFERAPLSPKGLDLPEVIERISTISRRPRYTFMVLNLIARIADRSGSAGPYVRDGQGRVPIRDWLCDALVPIAQRDARRQSIVQSVADELRRHKLLPEDAQAARALIDAEVRKRVRQSGRCNVSRAVSDLVRAGLLTRHYQGYLVDHHNRGGHREAVYTLSPETRAALHP